MKLAAATPWPALPLAQRENKWAPRKIAVTTLPW
jgi:hypothetical protein